MVGKVIVVSDIDALEYLMTRENHLFVINHSVFECTIRRKQINQMLLTYDLFACGRSWKKLI